MMHPSMPDADTMPTSSCQRYDDDAGAANAPQHHWELVFVEGCTAAVHDIAEQAFHELAAEQQHALVDQISWTCLRSAPAGAACRVLSQGQVGHADGSAAEAHMLPCMSTIDPAHYTCHWHHRVACCTSLRPFDRCAASAQSDS